MDQYEGKRLFDIGRYATEEDVDYLVDPIIEVGEGEEKGQYPLV